MSEQFKIKEITDDKSFDPSSLTSCVPFTQAHFYGNWQKKLNRNVWRFLITENGENVCFFQIIKYPLLFGKSYFYIPYGPVVKKTSKNLLSFLMKELRTFGKTKNMVFGRLDFTPPITTKAYLKYFTQAPLYTYHSAYFQPRVEWFVDIQKSESDLLSAMHEKTRYSIRLAGRKGITTRIITENFKPYFEIFYQCMEETALRNGFSLHHKSYYEHIFNDIPKDSYLSIAEYNGEVLAIDLIIVYDKIANYVFGGSRTHQRNRMPTYAAQWTAICHAKQLCCEIYNFGGIATERFPYKGWEGLTIYKKKFGGFEQVHSDFVDIVVSPLWYWLYNFRKLSKKLFSRS